MQFRPAQSITEQVADHLASEIITGVRGSGSRIQEMTLAKALSVSRGSVREALLVLEGRHLVDILPRRGAVVSAFDKDKIIDFSEVYDPLQLKLFKSLAARTQVDFAPLEGALGHLEAALEATSEAAPETVSETVSEAVSKEGGQVAVLTALDEFVQGALANVTDYFLGEVMQSLLPVRLRLAHLAAQHRDYEPRDLLRYHRALYEAMVARDSVRVEELVTAFTARELQLALLCPAVLAS